MSYGTGRTYVLCFNEAQQHLFCCIDTVTKVCIKQWVYYWNPNLCKKNLKFDLLLERCWKYLFFFIWHKNFNLQNIQSFWQKLNKELTETPYKKSAQSTVNKLEFIQYVVDFKLDIAPKNIRLVHVYSFIWANYISTTEYPAVHNSYLFRIKGVHKLLFTLISDLT